MDLVFFTTKVKPNDVEIYMISVNWQLILQMNKWLNKYLEPVEIGEKFSILVLQVTFDSHHQFKVGSLSDIQNVFNFHGFCFVNLTMVNTNSVQNMFRFDTNFWEDFPFSDYNWLVQWVQSLKGKQILTWVKRNLEKVIINRLIRLSSNLSACWNDNQKWSV